MNKEMNEEYWRLIREVEELRDAGNKLIWKADDLLKKAEAILEQDDDASGE